MLDQHVGGSKITKRHGSQQWKQSGKLEITLVPCGMSKGQLRALARAGWYGRCSTSPSLQPTDRSTHAQESQVSDLDCQRRGGERPGTLKKKRCAGDGLLKGPRASRTGQLYS